jgi:hypothetical protein
LTKSHKAWVERLSQNLTPSNPSTPVAKDNAMRFALPFGQPLKGGSMFITRGSVVDDISGSFRVVYSPDRSHLGEALPPGWIVSKDAIPLDQSAYNTMRARYQNREIVSHDDAKANIVRTPDL